MCYFGTFFIPEGDWLTRTWHLDEKDIKIVSALEELGAKISTEELSQKTGYPARTVRYRLQKMRDNNAFWPTRALTHERKLGLGENLLLLRVTPGSDQQIENLIKKLDPMYFWSSTYGTYTGYVVNSLYSVTTPHVTRRIAEVFQEKGLVSDFFIFDITDWEHKLGDFSYLKPVEGWTYDWTSWHSIIEKNLRSRKKKIPTTCEETPPLVDFDNTDFDIIRAFFDNGDLTQKEVAKQLALSEAIVAKKIRRLERERIIKGYLSVLRDWEKMIYFAFFFEVEESAVNIVSSFYAHPFPGTIMMESKTRWCVRMDLPSKDLYGFLRGLDIMRPYFKSSAFQVIHTWYSDRDLHPFDLYNRDTHTWETPVSKYLQTISEVMEKKQSQT
ncbi:winged helix-turn-helix transcriptional regulator [Candidatus Thorarchaeota archaeon]|nr:MAG: winged helix-turn-helix transcriptional regulator [Candidatus Thorarchaeota archaeon]